jgi:flagellar biosynthesis/type III secretory pathway protein FliH
MGVTADTPTQVTTCITYSEEEIQDLLQTAQLEGYEEGYTAGMEEMEGQRYREGFEEGRVVGKAERC